jgi:hypothetical protein
MDRPVREELKLASGSNLSYGRDGAMGGSGSGNRGKSDASVTVPLRLENFIDNEFMGSHTSQWIDSLSPYSD